MSKHYPYDPEPIVQCDGQVDLFAPPADDDVIETIAEPSAPTVTDSPHFDGETYDPVLDHARLSRQVDRVLSVLFRVRRDGDEVAHTLGADPEDYGWRTLDELLALLGSGISQTSLSARLRDLRKPRFGGFQVDRRRREPTVEAGLWEYRLAGQLRPVQQRLSAAVHQDARAAAS